MSQTLQTPSIDPTKKLSERALLVASSFSGVSQEDIDGFLKAARGELGQPWGAAFVAYCLHQAGRDFYAPNYGDGVRYPASAASWVEWARAAGRWSRTPRRGRLFAIFRNGEGTLGFVTADHPDGTFETIEADGQIQRQTRTISSVSGFIDLS